MNADARPAATTDGASETELSTDALRAEVRRLSAIVDALGDRTMVVDIGGLVKWQSERSAASFVERDDTGLGFNPLERVHPEDLPLVLDTFASAVNTPRTLVSTHVRSRAVPGQDVWQRVEIVGWCDFDDPDLEGIVVQVRSLDAGEEVESVGETDGGFLSLAEAAPIGIVVDDAFGRTVYRNKTARSILGRDGSVADKEWRALVRESFRETLEQMIGFSLLSGETASTTAAFDLEDGSTRWLRVHLTPRRSGSQQTMGVITTLEDVTAEVEARAETERLTQMLDATPDYVAVFKPRGEILYANAATLSLLESLSDEGAKGQLGDLVPDSVRESFYARAMEVMEHDDLWEGEAVLKGPGGRTIPVSALVVIHRGPEGIPDWFAFHARDISELKEVQERLRTQATHDHLTGLPNRALFNDHLDQAVARHKRERRGVAVMFCDLDGFKAINDDRGHAAGDDVLIEIADRLRAVTRDTDTPARVGGDEFVVVCEGVTDTDDLATLAERVIEAVSRPIELPDGDSVRVGISVGVGVVRSRQLDVDTDKLLTLADTAMYAAKAKGGNRYRISALEND